MSDFEKKLEQKMLEIQGDSGEVNEELVEDNLPVGFSDDKVPEYHQIESVIDATGDKEVDYVKVRDVYYGLIARGQVVLEQAIRIAQESDQPRAIDTSVNAMNALANISKDLLGLSKIVNSPAVDGAGVTNNTQNNYYGQPAEPTTTKELLDSLKDLQKVENDVVSEQKADK